LRTLGLYLAVVAPAGMVASIEVAERIVNGAETPLNVTAVTSLKPTPVTVTCVPTGPVFGDSAVIEKVTE